ncbi:hypothetical protein M3221_16970 [Domibacillus indicus]|uniref:hypothetical protein n=1 Tax=Domibacillus indicus TaxID=1437523 RepID=UPI00203CD747|nr:hypothetical protein [Domibacillus indicus]MCM3790081.1 hypothetical protein [Domibacillus indicus]
MAFFIGDKRSVQSMAVLRQKCNGAEEGKYRGLRKIHIQKNGVCKSEIKRELDVFNFFKRSNAEKIVVKEEG